MAWEKCDIHAENYPASSEVKVKLDMMIHTQTVISAELPFMNLWSSSLFLLSLSVVLNGSTGGVVDTTDRSGNSGENKQKNQL